MGVLMARPALAGVAAAQIHGCKDWCVPLDARHPILPVSHTALSLSEPSPADCRAALGCHLSSMTDPGNRTYALLTA